jgi:acyl carrier protein
MEDRIKEILLEVLDTDASKLTPTASIVQDLGADSVDQVELMQRLEKEFKISVREADVPKLKTIGSIVAFVAERTHVAAVR